VNISNTRLNGIFEIENSKFEDNRGSFIKIFNEESFKGANLETDFKESFFSISKKNTIRGMHFQLPPHDHAKLVYVVDGEVLDVALDMRKHSPTFGECFSTKLSFKNAKSLYISKGFAHGFLVLSEKATVVYLTTAEYNVHSESGVRWDSFGFDWGVDTQKILSKRDKSLPQYRNGKYF